MNDVIDKTVLISGASSGIGRCTVENAIKAVAKVVLGALSDCARGG